jgi:molecular chaperone GrpE
VTEADDEVVIVDGEIVDDYPTPPEGAGPDHADELASDDVAAEVTGDDLTPGEQEEILRLFPEVVAKRDEYLDTARRLQAEFENYKRRVEAQRAEQTARAAEQLVVELLPVLDACEAAIAHGAADVEPVRATLVGTLTKLGLAVIDEKDVPFDPNVHEAVISEPGGETEGPVVAEVMRTGFAWNGRVVRPAMVKVRG